MFNSVTFIERLIYSVSTWNIIKCMILCVCFIDHLFKPHNLSTKSFFTLSLSLSEWAFWFLNAVLLYTCLCLYNKYTLHKSKSQTNVSNINVCDMHITNYGSFITKQLFLYFLPFRSENNSLFYFKATLLPHFRNNPTN